MRVPAPLPVDSVTQAAAPPAGNGGTAPATGPGAAHAAAAADTAGGEDDLRNKGFFGFLVACVLGGLFSLIMPCVYPLIPVTVTFFASTAKSKLASVAASSVCFCVRSSLSMTFTAFPSISSSWAVTAAKALRHRSTG